MPREDHPLDALTPERIRGCERWRSAATGLAATLVHYGSDFVFDGTASAPYDETAAAGSRKACTAPPNFSGEWMALAMPRAYVLRVESLFGTPRGFTGRTGSMENIARALEEGREVAVFHDRIVTPGYVADIAAATRHPRRIDCSARSLPLRATEAHALDRPGGGSGSPARCQPTIRAVASASVSLKARRPLYSALSTTKLAATGFAMPPWRDALKRWTAARVEAPV
jgi:dTDP-4-dehydrorhamnose reductase